jgi:D-glycero-alpha-D-manno-heptose-7-phosphate kinase
MAETIRKVLEKFPVETSVPCRIDVGGTLDISTFYYPLKHLKPCTVNMAIDLRTRVRLFPYAQGVVKISSKGFETAEYQIDQAPFDHPLGLMFAVAAHFRAGGVHIDIESSSPPRSALGGSSAAAVALVAAFSKVLEQSGEKPISREKIALIAHVLEAGVAGVPCGHQDQLAAVYGGINVWYWRAAPNGPSFKKESIVRKNRLKDFEKHLLLAYGGVPHESKDVNGKWVRQFLAGKYRGLWSEIIVCTQKFAAALMDRNLKEACLSMNRETAIRREMTPEVLDEMGVALVEAAMKCGCGARFTGAGGGGCLWALGEVEDIDKLKRTWEIILSTRNGARLLDARLDAEGLVRAP